MLRNSAFRFLTKTKVLQIPLNVHRLCVGLYIGRYRGASQQSSETSASESIKVTTFKNDALLFLLADQKSHKNPELNVCSVPKFILHFFF